jgi:hypothetical protein
MLALLYLGLAICVGDRLCGRFFRYLSTSHRWATATLVGLVLMLMAFLVGWFVLMGRNGIRVNAIGPDLTQTPQVDYLTGFEDGTENPKGDNAIAAGIVQGKGDGMNGSSFVAVQQWVHNFARFDALSPTEQDHSIGRRKSDNQELPDAPASAHVKRTAQESFEPEAFVLRRSMPWGDGVQGGLNFVAFGKSFDAFEAQLKRMVGAEDGIVDGLFQLQRHVGIQLAAGRDAMLVERAA